jgi:iron only hydrogenase large subunit-like protein
MAQIIILLVLIIVVQTICFLNVHQIDGHGRSISICLERAVTSNQSLEKKEKFTKEALELLQAIESKENGSLHLIIAQVAPSVRVAIPEEFGCEPGTLPTGKLVASLKAIGFDLVLDTNTAADLTICEGKFFALSFVPFIACQ